MMSYICHYSSPLGGITLASDKTSLTGLWFDGQKYFGSTLSGADEEKKLPIFDEAIRWLDIYFSGKEPDFTPPLAVSASPFRKTVLDVLRAIPYGTVMTYSEAAKKTALKNGLNRMSAQAIGGAVGHNPISIIIPCHRVVGVSGSLTGYAGGIEKKYSLLKLEGVDMERLFIPKNGTAL